jgi:hypothetical protein
MSDDSDDIDREISVVHRANEQRLNDIEEKIDADREKTEDILADADALLESDELPPDESRSPDKTPFGNQSGSDEARLIKSDSDSPLRPLLVVDSWDDIVSESEDILAETVEAPPDLTAADLLSSREIREIDEYLNRPMYQRLGWDRWDYFLSFGLGLLGGVLDIVVGTPGHLLQEKLATKNSWIGGKMEEVHGLHGDGAPIDYTGENFGGQHHRGLSPGHDLMRFAEGIRQFKDGEFRGVFFEDGEKIPFSTATNEYGNSYASLSIGQAVWRYSVHMFCDFFSSTSLPIPGTSILRESSSREIRVLAERELYQQGFNLRHVALQTIPPLVIEVAMRCYCTLRYRNEDSLEKEAVSQKVHELATTAHSISLGFNVGKIIVTGNPLMLNAPQAIATSARAFCLALSEYNRNSFTRKIQRNVRELSQETQKLERAWEKYEAEPLRLTAEQKSL